MIQLEQRGVPPPHWQAYLTLVAQLRRIPSIGTKEQITQRIRRFYIDRFPPFAQYLQQYQPVLGYSPSRRLVGMRQDVFVFQILPISYPTFYIMSQHRNQRTIKANLKRSSIKDFLQFTRQINFKYLTFFVTIRKDATANTKFRRWLQNVYTNFNDDIHSVLLFPWQLRVRTTARIPYKPVSGLATAKMYVPVDQQINYGRLMDLLYSQQQLAANIQNHNDILQNQTVDRLVRRWRQRGQDQQVLQRHLLKIRQGQSLKYDYGVRQMSQLARESKQKWAQIHAIIKSAAKQLFHSLYFLRDFIASTHTMIYHGTLTTAQQFANAIYTSVSAKTRHNEQQQFIWINISPYQIYTIKTQQKMMELAKVILVTFFKKLFAHSNFYGYQADVIDHAESITSFTLTASLRNRNFPRQPRFYTMRLPRQAIVHDRRAQEIRQTFQAYIYYTGNFKTFTQMPTVGIVGTFYLFRNPSQDCFQMVVDQLISLKLICPSKQLQLKALKDPFVLSQLCQDYLPIINRTAMSMTNVRAFPLKQLKRTDNLCIIISAGHIQLGQYKQARQKAPEQFIWKPSPAFQKNSEEIQRHNIGVLKDCLRRQLTPSGKDLKLINKFSYRYMTGMGFVDIQTLMCNNVKQAYANTTYLACIVYADPTQKYAEYVEQYFDYQDHGLYLNLQLVKRMIQISRQYYKRTGNAFHWISFNGLKFDFFIMWEFLMKSLICIGSFGIRAKSKGFYTQQMKLLDMRTIYNRGTLKQLTKNQFYKKTEFGITKINTIQDYLAKKQQILKYCYDDCRCLMQLTHQHYSTLMELLIMFVEKYPTRFQKSFINCPRKIINLFTASSESMYILRHVFFPAGLKRLSPEQSSKKHRQFINGGAVQVFKHINRFGKKLIEFDVIGMYSAIMMLKLPLKQIFRYTRQQIKLIPAFSLQELMIQQKQKDLIHLIVVTNIRLKTNCPCIPVRTKNGGLIFPNFIQRALISLKQIYYFLQQGVLQQFSAVNIEQIIVYQTKLTNAQSPTGHAQPIAQCVRQLMEIRKQFKAKISTQQPQYQLMSDFCKLMINSISGKFLMRFFPNTMLTVPQFQLFQPQFQHLDLQQQYPRPAQHIQQKQGYDVKVIQDFNDQDKPYIGDLVHIGAYITAQGRFQIFRAINSLVRRGFDVYYTDTDSIWVDQQGAQALKKLGFVGKQCGQLQQKKTQYDYGTFINRKCYILIKQLPKIFQQQPLSHWKNLSYQQQQKMVKEVFNYQFTSEQKDKFRRTSPMTLYLMKQHIKIGFKGFSLIPHWTQLVMIQYSFVITHAVARLLHQQPKSQSQLPILNSQYLSMVTQNYQFRCNKLFEYLPRLQALSSQYIDIVTGVSKKMTKMLSQQNTLTVQGDSKTNAVNFLYTKKVLNLNAKRVIQKQGFQTTPYYSLAEYEQTDQVKIQEKLKLQYQ